MFERVLQKEEIQKRIADVLHTREETRVSLEKSVKKSTDWMVMIIFPSLKCARTRPWSTSLLFQIIETEEQAGNQTKKRLDFFAGCVFPIVSRLFPVGEHRPWRNGTNPERSFSYWDLLATLV